MPRSTRSSAHLNHAPTGSPVELRSNAAACSTPPPIPPRQSRTSPAPGTSPARPARTPSRSMPPTCSQSLFRGRGPCHGTNRPSHWPDPHRIPRQPPGSAPWATTWAGHFTILTDPGRPLPSLKMPWRGERRRATPNRFGSPAGPSPAASVRLTGSPKPWLSSVLSRQNSKLPARKIRTSTKRSASACSTLGRGAEAAPHFARAHAGLVADLWLVEHEPDRLKRLQHLATAAPPQEVTDA